ncbi:MAG: ankyrin repeat domain-containing protein, partial [Deltaproteobacteria bacterium]|nr:ankyrin repeat domain-containing protein [Deltaproteobacteria bacterium]
MKKYLFLLALMSPVFAFAGAYEDMEQAMIRRDASVVIELLGRGMEVNTVDRSGDTLLIQAVRLDMAELIDYLVQRRARLNSRNRNGETALSIAAFMGKMPYVQRLVEAGAELNFYG